MASSAAHPLLFILSLSLSLSAYYVVARSLTAADSLVAHYIIAGPLFDILPLLILLLSILPLLILPLLTLSPLYFIAVVFYRRWILSPLHLIAIGSYRHWILSPLDLIAVGSDRGGIISLLIRSWCSLQGRLWPAAHGDGAVSGAVVLRPRLGPGPSVVLVP